MIAFAAALRRDAAAEEQVTARYDGEMVTLAPRHIEALAPHDRLSGEAGPLPLRINPRSADARQLAAGKQIHRAFTAD